MANFQQDHFDELLVSTKSSIHKSRELNRDARLEYLRVIQSLLNSEMADLAEKHGFSDDEF